VQRSLISLFRLGGEDPLADHAQAIDRAGPHSDAVFMLVAAPPPRAVRRHSFDSCSSGPETETWFDSPLDSPPAFVADPSPRPSGGGWRRRFGGR
jgi:hypothetical protein